MSFSVSVTLHSLAALTTTIGKSQKRETTLVCLPSQPDKTNLKLYLTQAINISRALLCSTRSQCTNKPACQTQPTNRPFWNAYWPLLSTSDISPRCGRARRERKESVSGRKPDVCTIRQSSCFMGSGKWKVEFLEWDTKGRKAFFLQAARLLAPLSALTFCFILHYPPSNESLHLNSPETPVG